MRRLYAVKRLAEVEVEPETSNQHEFNAGLLRKALDLSAERISGKLEFLFYEEDRRAPAAGECEFTLYNAREGKPRSAEYRLYYTSCLIERHARSGDLLVVTRLVSSKNLQAFVIRKGTRRERQVLQALEVDDTSALSRFLAVRKAGRIPEETADSLFDVKVSSMPHPLIEQARRTGVVPPPRQLAAAANALVSHVSDPDDFIDRALTTETDLFMAAEAAVHTPRLEKLVAEGKVSLDGVLGFAMSIHQSRRSRRGASLQLHFAGLLTRERIPHTSQCETERGETPDFVIPGKKAYDNPAFPAGLLRMVACKSTVRERWGQILKEARRIPEKFLLTLDDKLTDDTIAKMSEARLRVFLPSSILAAAYQTSRQASRLGRVRDLVQDLQRVTS